MTILGAAIGIAGTILYGILGFRSGGNPGGRPTWCELTAGITGAPD